MPNGYYDSKEKWDRMEAPLIELDSTLEEYAREHDFTIKKNYHNWPSRALRWSDKDIDRVIQVYLENEKELSFNLWIAASRDDESKRYWKNDFIKKEVPIIEIKTNLRELLDIARATVTSWQSSDLEFAVYLSGSKEFEEEQRKNKMKYFKRLFGL